MKGRSSIQCLHRWTKILQPGLVKGPWTIEEDKKLIEWVKLEGPKKWASCAEFIKGRNGKQCRERWFNALNPSVKKGSWTAEEDFNIFYLYNKYGSRWSFINTFFEGRTENSIKNRFYSALRRFYSEKNNKFDFHTDSLSINTYIGNVLLKFLPDALMEKSILFAKTKGCSIRELEGYDDIKKKQEKKEKEKQEKKDKAALSFNFSNDDILSFKAPKSWRKNNNQKERNNNNSSSSSRTGINIGNFNPVYNVSFNINSGSIEYLKTNNTNINLNNSANNNTNFSNNPVNKPETPDTNYKDMSLMELEQNIMNSCNTENFIFSDPNFNILDTQINNFVDNHFYDLGSDVTQEQNSNNNDPYLEGSNSDFVDHQYGLRKGGPNDIFDPEIFLDDKTDKIDIHERKELDKCSFKLPINEDKTKNHPYAREFDETPNIIVNETFPSNMELVEEKVTQRHYEVVKDLQKNVINTMQEITKEEKKISFGSLMKTLNDLEYMLKSTKTEILKFEKGEIVDKPDFNADNLFN